MSVFNDAYALEDLTLTCLYFTKLTFVEIL